MSKIKWGFLILILCVARHALGATYYQEQSDDYILGYVQAIFIHNYGIYTDALTVKNGKISLKESLLTNENPEQVLQKIKKATANMSGVKGVYIDHKNHVKSHKTRLFEKQNIENSDGIMPNHSLFNSLVADPKWPRFSLAYQYHVKNNGLSQAFAPNFGASFPIYRGRLDYYHNTEWEVGIQGGLFAIMNIGTVPSALMNADYYISMPLTFHYNAWSALFRIYHLSSHLGDEFMLTEQGINIKRINLSYEGVDGLVSYYYQSGLRLYGGGGYIIHKEPNSVKHFKVQTGAEYRFQDAFWGERLRPIIALDLKSEQMSNWTINTSLKAGFQIENSVVFSNEINLMLEAYQGKSFHGQFYKEKMRYIGLGIHAFL